MPFPRIPEACWFVLAALAVIGDFGVYRGVRSGRPKHGGGKS